MSAQRLNRAYLDAGAPAPVRIVHLGLGNFHRAHQAWHTHRAPDAGEWGIAAFTGRRPDMARALEPQDGLFTLITRDSGADSFEVVTSIVAVHDASEHEAFVDYLRRSEVAIVSMTVTEHGYLRGADGHLDQGREEVVEDLEAIANSQPVRTLPGRLVAGLAARREAGAGGITILSCDNLPDNGHATATVVLEMARLVDADLAAWIEQTVDFASSMVDRITPATTEQDVQLVTDTQGYLDVSPVPTEPFSEWVITGEFPAGRPAWEHAGVQLVPDVSLHEQRKLWLLNGSHSLLAYTAPLFGHQTIDEAVADETCVELVNTFWDEAQRHLDLPDADVEAYRRDLLTRYRNTGVRHQLAQIANDGSQKLPVRTIPVIKAERAVGNLPVGAATALAGWVLHLQGHGAPVKDPGAGPAQSAASAATVSDAVTAVLGTLDESLASDAELADLVTQRVEWLKAPN